jgi:DNA modification methylase
VIHIGDCLEVMRTLEANSVDAVVTDPPYGIRFMGKAWDGADIEAMTDRRREFDSTDPTATVRGGHKSLAAHAGLYDLSPKGMRAFQDFSRLWGVEAMRVMKPGAHLVSFASPRTYHRMVCGLEEAGLEIRDTLMWLFGSGFPKSHNLRGDMEGWGTALKPAHEPIVLARKPLAGTVAINVEAHGTGALNIDGCRVAVDGVRAPITGKGGLPTRNDEIAPRDAGVVAQPHELGRWPANVLHDGSKEVVALFPDAGGQQGPISSTAPSEKTSNVFGKMSRQGEASAERRYADSGGTNFAPLPGQRREDTGSAARFFYCAKASKEDRNDGLDEFESRLFGMSGAAAAAAARGEHYDNGDGGVNRVTSRKNHHPTVKPTDLMRWLCRLVTPPGGVVLDPFTGSGSTGRAAIAEGMRFVGIELDPAYAAIAEARCRVVQPGLSFGEAA